MTCCRNPYDTWDQAALDQDEVVRLRKEVDVLGVKLRRAILDLRRARGEEPTSSRYAIPPEPLDELI